MGNVLRGLGEPFRGVAPVVPNDNTDLPRLSLLYIGTSGDVSIVAMDGTEAILKSHPVGYLPGVVRRVKSTGTTASNIVALF